MLEISKLHIKAGNFRISDLNLSIEKSDYFVILGESGAGKTMILNAICGIQKADSGSITLDRIEISNKAPHLRNIGMVHQELSLFPHLTAAENIEYGLKSKGFTKEIRREKIMKLAREFDIMDVLDRQVSQLSGGEKQRVALARTLAAEPDIILLDEPLSSVDVSISKEIKALLRKINRNGQTIIHVTHQFEEALSLATKIAIIENGKIIQQGNPSEVFNNPRSRFVANLTGLQNFFKARIVEKDKAELSKQIQISLASEEIGNEGYISFDSKDVILSKAPIETSMANNFEGIISDYSPTSGGIDIYIAIAPQFNVHAKILEQTFANMNLKVGSYIWVHFKASGVKWI